MRKFRVVHQTTKVILNQLQIAIEAKEIEADYAAFETEWLLFERGDPSFLVQAFQRATVFTVEEIENHDTQ